MLVSIRKELNVFCQLSCSLGKQILGSFTFFSTTDFCWNGGNMFCFVYVGNNTEFLSSCAVEGLMLPFHYILSVSFKTH